VGLASQERNGRWERWGRGGGMRRLNWVLPEGSPELKKDANRRLMTIISDSGEILKAERGGPEAK